MLAINNLKRPHIAALSADGVCSEGASYLDGRGLPFSPYILAAFARLPPAIAMEIDFVVKATIPLDRFRATFDDCIALFRGVRLYGTDKLLKSDVVIVAGG